jgi:hypothetical protein
MTVSTRNAPAARDPWGRRRVLLWGAAAYLAALALRARALAQPMLLIDDFQILARSWTLGDAWDNLWVPANEHSMPLGRLSTWVLMHLAGRVSNVPLVFALQGPLALVAAMVLVYLLVRRELGHPLPALLALTLFGVNTHYQNAVSWFAASFAVLGLDMLLLSILSAQRWRQTGGPLPLALSAVWAGLALGWFSTGVLAGPLATLYLFGPDPDPAAPRPGSLWRRRLLALVPTLGTALSLALTMPHNAWRILELPRIEVEKTAWETLDPRTGLEYTLRALVDDLIPGAVGVRELTTPVPLVWVLLAVLAAAAAWWWWRAERRNLLLLGLGLVWGSYLLIFTARAYFPYEGMHHWGRYHLYAHLGLVLYLCGAWPGRRCAAFLDARPDWVVPAAAALLLGALLYIQWEGADGLSYDPQQAEDLHCIDAVDDRCRRYHIDAATAREALPPFCVAGSGAREVNGHVLTGWDFLRGSPNPRPMPVAQARRLLHGTDEP